MASRGARVTACDVSVAVVEAINGGRMLFDEPGVETLLKRRSTQGSFPPRRVFLKLSRMPSDVIIPVLLTSKRIADTRVMEEVTQHIASALRPGMMVSYETTLPVGTTRERLGPILERSGLRAGIDFDLIFSPERVKSRLVLQHLTEVPKIVGGVCSASSARGQEFYGRYLGSPTINVDSLEAAELAKIAGMVYRDVNIALANELAAYAESAGVDFAAVRAAANTDGESFLLTPGIGVGGHCTPVYPYFLIQDATRRDVPVALTSNSRSINDFHAERMLQRAERLGARFEGSGVLILGLGFRPKVKEHTLSSAFLLGEAARKRGAQVFLHDPLYSSEEIVSFGFTPWDSGSAQMPALVVLNTAHPEYQDPDFAAWHRRGLRYVIDGRNFWDSRSAVAAGLLYAAPGFGDQMQAMDQIDAVPVP